MLSHRVVRILWVAAVALGAGAGAETVDPSRAEAAAVSKLALLGAETVVERVDAVECSDGGVCMYVVTVHPVGFVLVAGSTDLPPVLGYSVRNPFPLAGPGADRLLPILTEDIELRRLHGAAENGWQQGWQQEWQRLEGTSRPDERLLQQWPPAGTTTTGGWVETTWSQSAPYNDSCPIDPVTGVRSVAGCPAVAMAQIIEYYRSTNGTRFDDGDDYYHAYAGRNYWIDDDHVARDFPSFPELSILLKNLDGRYASGLGADAAGAAALNFACGVAARQVYTSSGSGTFGVDQAVLAYERFAVEGLELLLDGDPELHSRLSANMRRALPAHLAVVNSSGTAGHNLVVDGWNTDEYYHLNFGWGGPHDGWYLLPGELPYDLTVIEGVIVDIMLALVADGFESGDVSGWASSSR